MHDIARSGFTPFQPNAAAHRVCFRAGPETAKVCKPLISNSSSACVEAVGFHRRGKKASDAISELAVLDKLCVFQANVSTLNPRKLK